MSSLHDLLHRIVDLLPHASESDRGRMHDDVDDVPHYLEQLADEQLDAEQPPAEPQQPPATPELEKTS